MTFPRRVTLAAVILATVSAGCLSLFQDAPEEAQGPEDQGAAEDPGANGTSPFPPDAIVTLDARVTPDEPVRRTANVPKDAPGAHLEANATSVTNAPATVNVAVEVPFLGTVAAREMTVPAGGTESVNVTLDRDEALSGVGGAYRFLPDPIPVTVVVTADRPVDVEGYVVLRSPAQTSPSAPAAA